MTQYFYPENRERLIDRFTECFEAGEPYELNLRLITADVITVDVLNSDFERVAAAIADHWGTDGIWTVEVNTTGLEPDTYTIETTAADATDRVELRVIESTPQLIINETETPVQLTAETQSSTVQATEPTATPTPLTSATEEQATAPGTVADTETSTEATGAGFNITTAVVALMLIFLWSRNS